MNVVVIFLLFIIIIVVILVLVEKSGRFKAPTVIPKQTVTNKQYNANLPANKFTPSPVWGQPKAYGSTGGIECNTYTFIGGAYIPAAPSYSLLNESQRGYYIDRNNNPSNCLDVDQLYASNVTIKCTNPTGTSAGAGCILTVQTSLPESDGGGTYGPGSYVPAGTVQGDPDIGVASNLLYTQCTPSNLITNPNNGSPYCLGNIGLIVPYFNAQSAYDIEPSSNTCLSAFTTTLAGNTGAPGAYYNTTLQSCDLSEPDQIFRITRYTSSINTDTNEIVLTQDDTGILASITHRYTGYYLAPQLELVNEIINNVTVSSYAFDVPIFAPYDNYTDLYGNNFRTYSNLQLINPEYDPARNGVYWLLQNQTFNVQYSNDNSVLSQFLDFGIYPNQTNYNAEFPSKTAPTQPSYWSQQVAMPYCASATGGGPTCPPSPRDLTASGAQNNCYFGSQNGSIGFVNDAPADIAPQQMVYVPDLRLLPDTTDPVSVWSYLVNNFSINISSDNVPIVAPYRQKTKVDLAYGCKQDPNSNTNLFTILAGVQASDGGTSDSQFINYSNFIRQIQTPVSGLNASSTSSGFSGNVNPFNKATLNSSFT